MHYLEYLNTKHTNQVNQLTAENDALRQRVEALPELIEHIQAMEHTELLPITEDTVPVWHIKMTQETED